MAEKKQANVTMRVRIGDNEFEVSGPRDYVEKKIAEFYERQKTISAASITKDSPHSAQTLSPKDMSVAQFFKKVTLKSDVDRVLAAGYYLEKYKKEDRFTAAEISKTIKDAKIPPPKNVHLCVHRNIKKGHLMASGDKDGKMATVLTSDGEEAIEALLNA